MGGPGGGDEMKVNVMGGPGGGDDSEMKGNVIMMGVARVPCGPPAGCVVQRWRCSGRFVVRVGCSALAAVAGRRQVPAAALRL